MMPCTASSAVSASKSSAVMPDLSSLPVTDTDSVPAPMFMKEEDRVPEKPETVVISAITAVTPIRMPSTVRKERMRLCSTLDRDMLRFSRNMFSLALIPPRLPP